MKGFFNAKILSLVLLSLFSCAEEPDAVANGRPNISGDDDRIISSEQNKNAVIFKGSDFDGEECNLALSSAVINGEKVFLVKVAYVLHNESLPDITTSFYRFELGPPIRYNDIATGIGRVTLANAYLNNGAKVDLNKLPEYEADGVLIYSVRVETNAANANDYENALDQVIDDPSQFAAFSSTLNQVRRVILKKAHVDHYDAAGCFGMNIDGVEKTIFKL